MKLVVAVDQEWGIGNKGDLLARVRADLLHFKELTLGKTVILGSNTLATFPGGKPLKNRKNLVLNPSADYHVEGATVVHSLDELFRDRRCFGLPTAASLLRCCLCDEIPKKLSEGCLF